MFIALLAALTLLPSFNPALETILILIIPGEVDFHNIRLLLIKSNRYHNVYVLEGHNGGNFMCLWPFSLH